MTNGAVRRLVHFQHLPLVLGYFKKCVLLCWATLKACSLVLCCFKRYVLLFWTIFPFWVLTKGMCDRFELLINDRSTRVELLYYFKKYEK